MIDLSRVRNYYVACGYTDLRRGIDGLAAIVMTQYGACFSFVDGGRIASRRCTGPETVTFSSTNV